MQCYPLKATSEATERGPQAGWQLMTFAIVLSSDPSAASGTIKKLLDDGALWSLDTTRQPVLFMVAVLAMIDILSFLDNCRYAPHVPLYPNLGSTRYYTIHHVFLQAASGFAEHSLSPLSLCTFHAAFAAPELSAMN